MIAAHPGAAPRIGRWLIVVSLAMVGTDAAERPNLLLITADDLAADSLGAFGCPLPDITPQLDRLAMAGRCFELAHVAIAICQPSRAAWLTGRYPHRSGALGFDPIDAGVPTLVEQLHDAGYRTGLFGKETHVVPTRHAAFDVIVPGAMLGDGRDPAAYAMRAREFFGTVEDEAAPFFLMVNLHDPHRPFAGSPLDERQRRSSGADVYPAEPHVIAMAEVPVPGFLPDLPAVRRELVDYYASVHRLDRAVGAVLAELDAAGLTDRTLVMFLSDHGMSVPFAKTTCYRAGTRTPLIVRWPGVVAAGTRDATHVLGGIDLAPTLLDAAAAEPLAGADGRSFLALLRGDFQVGRDAAFTAINTTVTGQSFASRAVQTATHGYIFNAWSDGQTGFASEAQSGRTWNAMLRAAPRDPAVAARVRRYALRQPEELFDHVSDPAEAHDLADDPASRALLGLLRWRLLEHLTATADPQRAAFRSYLFGDAAQRVVRIACVDTGGATLAPIDPQDARRPMSYPAVLALRLGEGFEVFDFTPRAAALPRPAAPAGPDPLDACAAASPDIVVLRIGATADRMDDPAAAANPWIDRLAALPTRPRILLGTLDAAQGDAAVANVRAVAVARRDDGVTWIDAADDRSPAACNDPALLAQCVAAAICASGGPGR